MTEPFRPTLETHADPLVKIDILYGHVEIQTKMRREGNIIHGEGRSLTYDRDGNLTKTSEWVPSGVKMEVWDEWPEQPKRVWWEFWK